MSNKKISYVTFSIGTEKIEFDCKKSLIFNYIVTAHCLMAIIKFSYVFNTIISQRSVVNSLFKRLILTFNFFLLCVYYYKNSVVHFFLYATTQEF